MTENTNFNKMADNVKQAAEKAKQVGHDNQNVEALGQVYDKVVNAAPFTAPILNFYGSITPMFVKNVLGFGIKETIPVASYAYTQSLNSCDYVMDSLIPSLNNEGKSASESLMQVKDKLSQRLNERAEKVQTSVKDSKAKIIEAKDKLTENAKDKLAESDIKSSANNAINNFITKVEESAEAKEASVYLLLNDVLVILKTVPVLPNVITSKIPGQKIPEEVKFPDACMKAAIDSHRLAQSLANSLLERYQKSKLVVSVQSVINSFRSSSSTTTSSSSPSSTTTTSET